MNKFYQHLKYQVDICSSALGKSAMGHPPFKAIAPTIYWKEA